MKFSPRLGLLLFVMAFAQIGCASLVKVKDKKPLSGMVICIDPGHGGQSIYHGTKVYTGGTQGVNSKMYESEANLNVGLVLRDKLKAAGAKVIMTRTLDLRVSGPTGVKDEELKRRVEIAEEGRAQLLVSLHHNYASNPAASGPSIFYYPAGDKLHRALAEAIHSENLKVMPGKDHRIHARGFTVLANTKIPAVIMEFGFMSNPQFDAKLQDVNFRYVEADAVYRGLVKFWKAHRTEVEQFAKRYYDPTQTPSPTVHTRFAKHKH